jgi:hypothetical protein
MLGIRYFCAHMILLTRTYWMRSFKLVMTVK